MDRIPRICLKKVEVVNYNVESNGSTSKVTMGRDGKFLRKEVISPQPGTSGLRNPHSPARMEETREVGVSREVSPAPTKIMAAMEILTSARSRGGVAAIDGDSFDGSDVEIDVDEEVARIEETRRTGSGRSPTTWEHMSRRAKREEKTRVQKEEERERRATEALSCSAPKGRKWRKIKEEEEEIEAELIDAPTADIASKMIEQSVSL